MKMNSIQNEHLEKLIHREENDIKNGNTIIQSRVGIFNYPIGFGRKQIISNLFQKSLSKWNSGDMFEFEILDKLHCQGQIVRKNIITSKKTNFSILLCQNYNIPLWKETLESHGISCILFTKKSTLHQYENDKKDYVILTNPNCILYLLQNFFHRKAIKRFIICDPEFIKLKYTSTTMLFYGMTWIVCSHPNWIIYNPDKKHFIYNFISDKIDIMLFRSLFICDELNINKQLYKDCNLPPYEKIKHKCRESMYVILKGTLENEMYKLLEAGHIKRVLEKLNEMGSFSNILDYIHEKLDNDIEETNLKIQKKIFENEDTIELQEIKNNLVKKKNNLLTKIEEYQENNECVICNNSLKEPILIYCCQNIICGTCIFDWLNYNKHCPYCRSIIHNDDLISLKFKLNAKSKKPSNFKKLLTKQNKTVEILEKFNQKFIVFYSESNEIIQIITSFCNEKNLAWNTFQGSRKEKTMLFQKFQNKDFNILIISDKMDFVGFSFPFVDHFIQYSRLEESVYEYIFNKFYRLGRTEKFYLHLFQ